MRPCQSVLSWTVDFTACPLKIYENWIKKIYEAHWTYTEAVIFSLYWWLFVYRYSKPSHTRGLELPSGLPFEPYTTILSLQNHPERDVFVVPLGLNSLPKVFVLNKIIVSPVLSWPLVAKQPCLPEGHSSSLCTDAYGWCPTPGGWEAPTSPSKIIANQSFWHVALVAATAVD